ncbi:MAG: NADH-quinone oxidoreductase subunit F [Acidobacteria bacterium]|nr:MAG: NADH-quinone oxidoreductase subunit F [Acidobacteriota bacterium]
MILFPQGRPTQRETFDEYCAAGGYDALKKSLSPTAILREISASGLRGRGGAGFPAGRKWAVAAETPATPRYVVCNAGEDEPGSLKDRILIAHRPHLVLEGTILAARAIQAGHAYIYLNETYDDCFNRMDEAVREATAAGLLGSLAVTIHRAPTVYVAGEDSAAIEVVGGKPPLPRQNVETLANVPPIIRNGASWFRTHGTPDSPGTMLFCLGDEMNRPGAYELPLGTSLRYLYENVGNGLKNGAELKAILPGGPSCAFLTNDQLDVPLDQESLKKAGSTLGCGVMRFYSKETCMVEETLRIAQFFARESCGQCPACRMETNMLSVMLERIQQGKADAALFDQFQKIVDFNRGKGYCALINMPGPPILSAIRLFREEFEHHIRQGTCGV